MIRDNYQDLTTMVTEYALIKIKLEKKSAHRCFCFKECGQVFNYLLCRTAWCSDRCFFHLFECPFNKVMLYLSITVIVNYN